MIIRQDINQDENDIFINKIYISGGQHNCVSHNKHIFLCRIVGVLMVKNVRTTSVAFSGGGAVCEAASIFSSALSCPSVYFHISVQS